MVAPTKVQLVSAGRKGKWNLEQRDGTTGAETELQLSFLLGSRDEIADGLPVFRRRRFRVL